MPPYWNCCCPTNRHWRLTCLFRRRFRTFCANVETGPVCPIFIRQDLAVARATDAIFDAPQSDYARMLIVPLPEVKVCRAG